MCTVIIVMMNVIIDAEQKTVKKILLLMSTAGMGRVSKVRFFFSFFLSFDSTSALPLVLQQMSVLQRLLHGLYIISIGWTLPSREGNGG